MRGGNGNHNDQGNEHGHCSGYRPLHPEFALAGQPAFHFQLLFPAVFQAVFPPEAELDLAEGAEGLLAKHLSRRFQFMA